MIAVPIRLRNQQSFVVPEATPSPISTVATSDTEHGQVVHYHNGENSSLDDFTYNDFNLRISRDSGVNLSPMQQLQLTSLAQIDRLIHQAGIDINEVNERVQLEQLQREYAQRKSLTQQTQQNNEQGNSQENS